MNRSEMIKQGWDLAEDDQLDMIIQEVQALPIDAVLSRYGVEPVRHTGSRILALCPFHMDEHIGSFSMDTEKNACWCYACNQGGNAINSMKKIWKKTYVETVLQIACDFNLIDAKTYSSLIGMEYEKLGKEVKVVKERAKKRPSSETLSMWTEIYEFVRDWFGLLEEDEKTLRETRHVPEDRLKDYFSINTKDPRVISRLVFDLKSNFPEYADKLVDIPGFFEAKYRDRWQITCFEYDAVGILLRNAAGQVVAVQVRDKDKDADVRYKYFSYKVPTKSKYMRGGNTVGTPIDIIIPENWNGKVAIMEGRFKAELVAMQGFITMSVQGVNNFAGIEKDIKDIEAITNTFIKQIYVFYDADQLRNGTVYKAGIALGDYIKKKASKDTLYVIWDPDFGKGIDDLIINGKKYEAKPYTLEKYKSVYEESYEKALESTNLVGRTVASISKPERVLFYDAFETETRKCYSL